MFRGVKQKTGKGRRDPAAARANRGVFSQAILFGLVAYILFFSSLGSMGLVGPDEPRYAAVARHMAASGDYITPQLFGRPWFEKPPLYYWLTALLFRVRINEATARFPSACAALLFVGLWFWFAERFYGLWAAQFSCLMLISAAGWIGFARAASMDMLFSALLGAALVLLAVWLWEGSRAGLYGFYALLGLAALAKGPPAVVLAGLIVLGYLLHRREWWQMLRVVLTPAVGVFALVAVPWYWLCYARNGNAFIQEFFIHRNWELLISADPGGHPQPVWFYLAILLAAVFPWTPMLALPVRDLIGARWRQTLGNPQMVYLFYWVILPLVLFSAMPNKLPGYLLPIVAPLTLWIGCSVAQLAGEPVSADSKEAPPEIGQLRYWIGASAVLLLLLPWISALVPSALAGGPTQAFAQLREESPWGLLTRSAVPATAWLLVLLAVAGVWYFLWRGRALGAAGVMVLGVTISVLAISFYVSRAITRVASARSVAAQVEAFGVGPGEMAVFHLNRDQLYGLGFYLGYLPAEWQPQNPGQHATLIAAPEDVRVDQLKPAAQSLAIFPGERIQLWGMYGWP